MSDLVCVKITGLNLVRIIDKLISKNIYITNLIKKSKYIKFEIREDDLNELDKICKIERKFYKIVHKKGIKQIFLRIPYMLGSILAFILVYVYFLSFSFFVININLTYNSNLSYDLSRVSAFLNKNGIVSGMKKNKYSVSEIQNLIMLNIDDIEGCKVQYSGNNLNICLYPATNKYEVNTDNIYSKYDAVVEYAKVYSGNLKVKQGDIVKVGDILIENDAGASGEIKGKVYFSATKIYNENQQIINYTGNEYVVKDYNFFNIFTAKGKYNCKFKQFLLENCSFCISKNLFLPIYCNKTIYKEIEIEDIFVPFETKEEEIKNSAYLEAKAKISDKNEISNVTYSIVREKNYVRVDCFIEIITNLF